MPRKPRILCVCDKGVNRSVHIASLLKFSGFDTIPVGVETASRETLDVLCHWADKIIVTASAQIEALHPYTMREIWLWPIDDEHTRPYHPIQHRIVRRYIDDNRDKLAALAG